MTPAARLAALLGGNPPTEPLVFPMVVADHAARISSYGIGEAVTSADVLCRVLYTAWHEYGYDMVMVFTDTAIEAEAMGARVVIPEDDNPFLLEPPRVESLEPANPEQDGRMPVVLDATRRLREMLGEDVPVLTSIKGPFSLAAFLRGIERFLEDLLERPEEARRFLALATENQRRYAEAALRAGGIVFIGDPVASGSLIGPALFRGFARPFLADLVQHIHGLGSRVGLHVCGNTAGMVSDIIDTGADYLSLEIDAAVARQEAGPDVVLMGSVDTSLLLNGTPERVRAASEECLRKAGPYIILSTGCDVPRDASMNNVRAVVRTARNWRS